MANFTAICTTCLRGYESFAIGVPMPCVACDGVVRELAKPIDSIWFENISIPRKRDLKLKGRAA